MSEPERIPMPPAVEAFLRKYNRTYWLTLRKDGSPTAHPMSGIYEEGRLAYTSYKRSIKNRNVDRDPRTCVLGVNGYGPESDSPQAVTLKGVAVILDGAGAPGRLGREQSEEESGGTNRARTAIAAGRRAVIDIVPTELVGFTDQVRGV